MLDGEDDGVEVSDEVTDRLLSCDDGDESDVTLSEDSVLSDNDRIKVIRASLASKSVPIAPLRPTSPSTPSSLSSTNSVLGISPVVPSLGTPRPQVSSVSPRPVVPGQVRPVVSRPMFPPRFAGPRHFRPNRSTIPRPVFPPPRPRLPQVSVRARPTVDSLYQRLLSMPPPPPPARLPGPAIQFPCPPPSVSQNFPLQSMSWWVGQSGSCPLATLGLLCLLSQSLLSLAPTPLPLVSSGSLS